MKKVALAVFFVLAVGVAAQAADSAAVWNSINTPAFNPQRYGTVSDATLVHDGLRIVLKEGVIQFSNAAEGINFGATFRGKGEIQVAPPNAIEAQQLRLHTGQNTLAMTFTEAVFMFGETVPAEFEQKVKWSTTTDDSLGDLYRRRQQERENVGAEIVPRLFKALLSAERKRTSYFAAELKTDSRGWVLAVYDPLQPEEIQVGRWSDWGGVQRFDTWLSFPATGSDPVKALEQPLAKEDLLFKSYQIEATVKESADLAVQTRAELEWKYSGERVALFMLDSNLRVDAVKDDKGNALAFFQPRDPKDRPQSYGDYLAVVLAEPSTAGQKQALDFHYAGKRVVRKVGSGNFFCQSFGWYPTKVDSFASRSDFQMTFRSPKRYTLVATGSKIGESVEGNETITKWKSDIPLGVAGFAFGDYKVSVEKVGAVEVQVYGNRQEDDTFRQIKLSAESPLPSAGRTPDSTALGTLSAAGLVKTIGAEVANTLRLFENYFGPYPYKQLAVTNIPYSYGQGWPGLLYLSILSFLDSTQRNQLGIKDQTEITDFFRAHESSHQWWGHRVGWKTYHDQWLSEGFAQFSGNLYVLFRQNAKEYVTRLRLDKEALQYRDRRDRTYESLGPIWMGTRLASGDAPRGYAEVVYNKGGYVLQTIRAMMADGASKEPDRRFQELMKAFCQKFENQPASTADFKAVLEQHMLPSMDLEGNHKMDWFFRQYVYGTGVPQYEFRYTVEPAGEQWKVTAKLTQSRVPEGWMDALPIYVYVQGKARRLGLVSAVSRETPIEFTLPFKPEKLTINEYEDTLADIRQ